MPKAPAMRKGAQQRHDPLADQLKKDEARKYVSEEKELRKKKKRDWQEKVRKEEGKGGNDSKFMTSSLSRKILTTAREQIRDEFRGSKASSAPVVEEYEEFEEEDEDDEGGEMVYSNQDHFADLDISAADEEAMARFMSSEPVARRTLADIIMEKIQEKEKQDNMAVEGGDNDNEGSGQLQEQSGLNPQVESVYTSVGKLLSRYRAGKLPKAFKIIPSLRNWEEVLYVTDPESWSPQAMMAATRIFASNLNPRMAQRFYALVLLPRVRDDIHSNKVLNYHLYMALKKALYKPAAFFKGILLPLCSGGDCTLREATILGSVLAKVSIPMVHAAAAMLKIASMPYSGASSLFLRVLMDKKYSLPYKVVDALVVKHFASFVNDERTLPVLWHQALLVFAQRYKNVISKEQKQLLRVILRKHQHYKITPEIRRELFASGAVPGAVSMEE